MKEKILKRHTYCLNPGDNGGESVTIITKWIDLGEGDPQPFIIQSIELNSYGKTASIELGSDLLNPGSLQELASQLKDANLMVKKDIEENLS